MQLVRRGETNLGESAQSQDARRGMRIVHVGKYYPPTPGGMETAVEVLARGTAASGASVGCVVSNTSIRTVTENIDGVAVTRLGRIGTLASTPINPRLPGTIANLHADVVHFHHPNPMGNVALLRTRLPLVVTYHCDIVRYPGLMKLYEPILCRVLDRAHTIVSTSASLIDSSAVLSRYREKTQVIPLTVPTAHLRATPKRLAAAARLSAEVGAPFALFVGRLVRYKGLHHLIPALAAVRHGHLVVVGDGPERANLEALAVRSGVADRVHFAGYVADEDIGAYFHAATAVALPSIDSSEAFGLVLVEGLAVGKPLLTTRLQTGVREVNRAGETGLEVAVGDERAMAHALSRLFEDAELRARLGEGARAAFAARYQATAIVDAYWDVYAAAAAAQAERPATLS